MIENKKVNEQNISDTKRAVMEITENFYGRRNWIKFFAIAVFVNIIINILHKQYFSLFVNIFNVWATICLWKSVNLFSCSHKTGSLDNFSDANENLGKFFKITFFVTICAVILLIVMSMSIFMYYLIKK